MDIDALTSDDPFEALTGLLNDRSGPEGKLFARPPLDEDGGPTGGPVGSIFTETAPDVPEVFLERWVFPSEANLLQTMQEGFAMTWVGPHSASCANIDQEVAGTWRQPLFAEQLLTYQPPTVATAPLRGATMQAFDVYQPDEADQPDLRGWMLRLRSEIGAVALYQDHWLLTNEYDPLGMDMGQLTLVVLASETPRSVQAWMDAHADDAQEYTSATYSLSTLDGACFDRR